MKRFLTTMCTILIVLSVLGLSACIEEPGTTTTPVDCESCLDAGCAECREDHCKDCGKHEDQCVCVVPPNCELCSDEGCAECREDHCDECGKHEDVCECPDVCDECGKEPCECLDVCDECGKEPCECLDVCDECGKEPCECCEHTYSWDGNEDKCSKCGDVRETCTHTTWADGVCSKCSSICLHSAYNAATGKCTVCGIDCVHTLEWNADSEHKCTKCQFVADTCITHEWELAGNPMAHDTNCNICSKRCDGDVKFVTDAEGHVLQCEICPFERPGTADSHQWDADEGKCSVCQYECDHTSAAWGRAWGASWGIPNVWEKQCGTCNYVVEECGPVHVDADEDGTCDTCPAVTATAGEQVKINITFNLPADIDAPVVTPTISYKTTTTLTVTVAAPATWFVNGVEKGDNTASIDIDVSTLRLGDNVIRVVIGNFSRNVTFKVVD